MKTIFDSETKAELHERLGKLRPGAERRWGKMSASQMMEHTARALEMAAGHKPMKHHILGKLLGWIWRNEFLGEKPFRQNAPTGPDFIIKDEPDFESTRRRLNDLITEFHGLGEAGTDGNVHGFFRPVVR
jgi:hypothetical protein